jgi:hypothetical protein
MHRRRWLTDIPPEHVRESAPTAAGRSAEQNEAAGGHDDRQVVFNDGTTATASISLERFPRARRLYAYLRYKHEGHNYRRYVGDASAQTREEALRIAWRLVREKGLLAHKAPVRREVNGQAARDSKSV